MPIYAYRCEACGFAKDVLQKVSDAPLTVCPSCSKDAFKKQLTAAGFQLKGTGWYATDFRGGSSPTPPSDSASASGAKPAEGAAGKPASAASGASGASAAPAASTSSAAPAKPAPSSPT